MRTSALFGGAAVLGAAALAYYLTSQRSRPLRAGVQQRASASAQWLRLHQRELHDGFDRLEEQIAALGDEMRTRLDEIRRQAAGAVSSPLDLGEWELERDDVQHDLRGLPRR